MFLERFKGRLCSVICKESGRSVVLLFKLDGGVMCALVARGGAKGV